MSSRRAGSDLETAAGDLTTLSGAPSATERSLERAIGMQIRDLRRRCHLSVTDLAGAASISVGMLSKIENGQISASLATLQALAVSLNVPLSALLATFEEKRDCSFVRSGEGLVLERRGSKAGHLYRLLGHALAGEVMVEPYLITLTQEAAPYTGFRHAGVELIYMLTGEVVYRHTDQTYHLKPGDTLMFDSGGLHGPQTLLVCPMTYLSIIMYRGSPA